MSLRPQIYLGIQGHFIIHFMSGQDPLTLRLRKVRSDIFVVDNQLVSKIGQQLTGIFHHQICYIILSVIESITFITGNEDKVKDASRYVRTPITRKKLDLIEIQSLNLAEIVNHKAQEAYDIVGKPVLVEDVSLKFAVYGNLPGPLIKWFYEELGNDGLCKLLENFNDRSAIATVTYGYHDGNRVTLFEGSVNGKIAETPRGNWFAWSSIFVPDGYDQTWSEMTEDLRDETSMRKIALGKLDDFLRNK